MSEAWVEEVASQPALPAGRLEREAARLLAEALVLINTSRGPGLRERCRQLLALAIEHALRALGGCEGQLDSSERIGAYLTLARAYAAQAQDAQHGANQLSLSAQRAPTREACDAGWERVAALASAAEDSFQRVAQIELRLQSEAIRPATAKVARDAARQAGIASRAALRIVEERNHAYTFHTDNGFSFGEGWYLAAAAVLAEVAIQIEPGKPGTPQAEQFLRDAGLDHRIQSYRARPRAMKHTTHLIAAAFRLDPAAAQRRLRAAFLGEGLPSTAVTDWVDRRLAESRELASDAPKVLIWIRDGAHQSGRNTQFAELLEFNRRVQGAGLLPIWIGDNLCGAAVPTGTINMILFWKDPVFRGPDMRRAQLQFFEHLRSRHALIGQLGVTTAGMDGPALMGLPTLYLTDTTNVRMREWVGAVPEYQEVVRGSDYLDRITHELNTWAKPPREAEP